MPLFGTPNLYKMKARRDVKGLIRALRYQNSWERRWFAIKSLGEIGDTRAVKPLISVLNDCDERVRKSAVDALGKIGSARAVEPIIAVLKDSDESMRKGAAEALGEIGDARAIEPLIATLRDSDEGIRKSSAEALKKINWQPGRDEIGIYYWIGKKEWAKCVEIGAPAVEPLIATLKDSNEYVRYCAAEALEKIGWQPGQDESGARYWVIKREWAECIKIGDPAIDSLNVALKDYSEDVRKNAVVALEQIGGVRAVDLLIAALNDGNKGVRQAAAKALVAMYQDHELDHQASYQIICLQAKILEPHSDHHDDKFACGNFHIHHHTDQGVGVDFPL